MTLNEKNPRISVDLDGVLNLGETYRGPHHFSPVRTGATKFLQSLHDRGFEVVIHTARPVDRAKEWLRQNGLMVHVNDVTNEKLPSRVYVDDRALKFNGDFDSTLADVEEFKAHWEPKDATDFDYSTVMMNLPADVALKVKQIAGGIPKEALDKKGVETDPHVTVKFGLNQDRMGDLPEKLKGFGAVKARIGKLTLFEGEERDVLKFDVESEDLHRLNAAVCKHCPHVDTFPDYHPHITVAYLKPQAGKKLVGRAAITGLDMNLTVATFSDKSGKEANFLIE